jgi:multidrug efflux system membrane fusion protein
MKFRTTLFLSILSLLTVTSCNKSQSQASKNAGQGADGMNAPVPVSVAPVVRQDVPIILTGLGTVQAYNTVTLKTRVDGQIVSVNFREGQEVRKGQLLAVIDLRPYEVAFATAKANMARDVAQLNTAKANLACSKALLAPGVVAQQDFDTQEAAAGQFAGTVQADQAAIDNAKLKLGLHAYYVSAGWAHRIAANRSRQRGTCYRYHRDAGCDPDAPNCCGVHLT